MKKDIAPDQKNNALITSLDTSASTQRKQILALLQQYPSINTLEFRENHGIMAPAPRIFELRQKGYEIFTHLEDVQTDDGRLHRRVARYYFPSKQIVSARLAA